MFGCCTASLYRIGIARAATFEGNCQDRIFPFVLFDRSKFAHGVWVISGSFGYAEKPLGGLIGCMPSNSRKKKRPSFISKLAALQLEEALSHFHDYAREFQSFREKTCRSFHSVNSSLCSILYKFRNAAPLSLSTSDMLLYTVLTATLLVGHSLVSAATYDLCPGKQLRSCLASQSN